MSRHNLLIVKGEALSTYMVLAIGLLTTVVLVDEVVAVVDLVVADNLPIVYVHMSTPKLNCSTRPSNSIINPCNYQCVRTHVIVVVLR